MYRKKIVLLVSLVGLLILAACSPQSGQAPEDSAGPIEVKVSMTDFAFEPSQTEFKTGVTYRFVVTNDGQVPHEIMIMPMLTDIDTSGMDMHEFDEMALMAIEADDLPAGATQMMEYTFEGPADNLEFACRVPGHYEAGMRLPIMVE